MALARGLIVIAVALLAATGCADDRSGRLPGPPSPAVPSGTPPTSAGTAGRPTTATTSTGKGTLTFTRADGSRFRLEAGTIACGPSETDAKRRAVTVVSAVTAPAPTTYFSLEAIVDDVATGATIQLPHSYVVDDAHGATLFAYDKRSGNETSSEQEEGSGRLVFTHASCSPKPSLRVEVHARLGSEFSGGEVLAVEGTLDLQG